MATADAAQLPGPSAGAVPPVQLISGVIRLVVMIYVRFPWSLGKEEGLRAERGIGIYHETVPLSWTRFDPLFADEPRRQRVSRKGAFRQWR